MKKNFSKINANEQQMRENKKETNESKAKGKLPRLSKEELNDDRFKKVQHDPRFKKLKSHNSKITIDPRFKEMFTKEEFQGVSAKIDARGNPITKKRENLKKYYNLEEDEEIEQNQEEKNEIKEADKEQIGERQEETDGEKEIDSQELEETIKEEKEDEEEEEEDSEDEEIEAEYDEQDIPEDVPIGDATNRLAVVNFDWTRLRAVDFLVAFQSFVPAGGAVKSVTIYPSEYGLKKMEEELTKGPQGIFNESATSEENITDDEVDIDEAFDQEKLRSYEKQKIKYYYAVVECDSVGTASTIYKECDGVEIMSTSNFFDLRYIPDDTQFSHPPKEVATSIPVNYEPPTTYTKSLQQTKFTCSWDLTDDIRTQQTTKQWTEEDLVEDKWKGIIASSDEDESESESLEQKQQKIRDKYRALLEGINPKEKEEEDMEITFTSGLGESIENMLSKKKEEQEHKDETVFEAQMRKQKEKKKEKRKEKKLAETEQEIEQKEEEEKDSEEKRKEKAHLELLTIDESDVHRGPEQEEEKLPKKRSQKWKKKKQTQMTQQEEGSTELAKELTTDERFRSLLENPEFALDRTNIKFKDTPVTRAIMQERLQHRSKLVDQPTSNNSDLKKKRSLGGLVESVKKKAKQHNFVSKQT